MALRDIARDIYGVGLPGASVAPDKREISDVLFQAADEAVAAAGAKAASDLTAAVIAYQAGDTALGTRIDAVQAAQAVGVISMPTWAQLSGLSGANVGTKGEVAESDGGMHTDPVAGGTVPNGGTYSKQAGGWQRTGALLSTAVLGEIGDALADATPLAGAPQRIEADAEGRVLRSILTDGSIFERLTPDAAAIAAMRSALMECTSLHLILRAGQSNGEGFNTGSELTSRYVGIAAPCVHLNSGAISPSNTPFDRASARDFAPARERRPLGSSMGEGAGSSAMMRWLAKRLATAPLGRLGLCAANSSIGGRTIEELSKGSAYPAFANGIAQADRASQLAEYLYDGLPVTVPFVYWFQGESASASAAAYQAALLAIQTSYDTDIKATTGQTGDVHLILPQTSADKDSVSVPSSWQGQVGARDARPGLIHISSPRYWVALTDNTHLSSLSQVYMDEYAALCAWRAIYQPVPTQITSLRIGNASRAGAVWTLPFRKPPGDGAVYFEMGIVADRGASKGFTATDGGSADAVLSVAIDNTPLTAGGNAYDGKITVTLDGAPAGAAVLTYARGSGATGGSGPAAWGNVAAHSGEFSLHNPARELVDFLEIFEVTS